MLQDHSFRWLLRLAPAAPVQEGSKPEFLARAAQPYLYLPCGIIRGAPHPARALALARAGALARVPSRRAVGSALIAACVERRRWRHREARGSAPCRRELTSRRTHGGPSLK